MKSPKGYSSNDITPDQQNHKDPFHYGKKKYTPVELAAIKKQRAKDSRKYGLGSVVGAGAMTGNSIGAIKYTPVKPKNSSKINSSVRMRPETPEYIPFTERKFKKPKKRK